MKIESSGWEEFRKTGLLWWVNRSLHLFGWAIILVVDEDDKVEEVHVSRIPYRSFDEKSEQESFLQLTNYLSDNSAKLLEEVKRNVAKE